MQVLQVFLCSAYLSSVVTAVQEQYIKACLRIHYAITLGALNFHTFKVIFLETVA